MDALLCCPICNVKPKMGYACGDYFMNCSDGCPSPMCDHASKEFTVQDWNAWVLLEKEKTAIRAALAQFFALP
jgi:hypothetical protein